MPIPGTPFTTEVKGRFVNVSFVTNDSSKTISFECDDEQQAHESAEMWTALIVAAENDPAND